MIGVVASATLRGMMQKIRLETKVGELVTEIELPIYANGEPDAIVWGSRIFIRRPMLQTQPPKKNNPETYFEAFTHHALASGGVVKASGGLVGEKSFNRITETKPTELADE